MITLTALAPPLPCKSRSSFLLCLALSSGFLRVGYSSRPKSSCVGLLPPSAEKAKD